MPKASALKRRASKTVGWACLISPPVVAASTEESEEDKQDDEHPQQRTHGDASNQRQDDQNAQQKHDEIHVYDPTPNRAKAIRDSYLRTAGKAVDGESNAMTHAGLDSGEW